MHLCFCSYRNLVPVHAPQLFLIIYHALLRFPLSRSEKWCQSGLKKRTFECKAGILLQPPFPSLLFLGDDGGFTQDWSSCAMRRFSNLRLSGIQNTCTSSKILCDRNWQRAQFVYLHAASRVAFRKGPYEESKIALGSAIKPGIKF